VTNALSRRDWLASGAAAVGAGLVTGTAVQAEAAGPPHEFPFRFCLNTSTISGQRLSLIEEVEIAAKAGYQGIEPWVRELEQYAKEGGNLKELGRRIRDRGLQMEDAIAFFEWIVDDDARRKKGLEDARRGMDLVAQVGGKYIAAPPAGATSQSDLHPLRAAERYRALLDIGSNIGVIPIAEVWGFSKTLTRLGDAAFIAIESHHPDACVLPDIYHLYKGGSAFQGIKLLSNDAIHIIHMNDYPADPPRTSISDAQRIYPGDGIAPWKTIVGCLRDNGYHGALSLELFNRDYWKQDALLVARTGLEKMRAVVGTLRVP
jgi:2-keto-myo-inositol isomerase